MSTPPKSVVEVVQERMDRAFRGEDVGPTSGITYGQLRQAGEFDIDPETASALRKASVSVSQPLVGGAHSMSDDAPPSYDRPASEVRAELARRGHGHWEKQIKKTIYTLNIDNYEPAIRELCFPLLQHYAKKIGADLHIITERKFPEWPVTYEKLQVYELAKQHGNDWNIYIDADALINPECFDFTDHLHKDTVSHNGRDMAGIRWSIDPYFRRDGRWIGRCNWLAIASDWCLDLWRPLDDLTPEHALERIHVTVGEHNSGHCKPEHLIDDYTLSRNIARFGLKFLSLTEICGNLGWKVPRTGTGPNESVFAWGETPISPFLFHMYNVPTEQKIEAMLQKLTLPMERGGWALMTKDEALGFCKKYGITVKQ